MEMAPDGVGGVSYQGPIGVCPSAYILVHLPSEPIPGISQSLRLLLSTCMTLMISLCDFFAPIA